MKDKTILYNLAKFQNITTLFIIFLVLICFALPGQTSEKALNSSLSENFQTALDEFQKHYGFPGATAAYVLQDGTVGIAASGLADIEQSKPMKAESRMLSASIGKTFVGATVIALSTEGVLDLDAPISFWLGDRKWFSRLPNQSLITLRHLLTHSSGLPDHVHLDSFTNAVSYKWREIDNPFTPEELIEFVLDTHPLFEAGKGWGYSDTGYILIGLIVEVATGRSLWDEITIRFLTKHNLTPTTPSDRCSLPGLAAGYMAANNLFGFPKKNNHSRRHNGLASWVLSGLVEGWSAILMILLSGVGCFIVDVQCLAHTWIFFLTRFRSATSLTTFNTVQVLRSIALVHMERFTVMAVGYLVTAQAFVTTLPMEYQLLFKLTRISE